MKSFLKIAYQVSQEIFDFPSTTGICMGKLKAF